MPKPGRATPIEPENEKGPLDGIRVLDWTLMQQGPVAGMLLGDMGAEVIKIEQRGVGDPGRTVRRTQGVLPPPLPGGHHWYYETFNRNKKGIAIDLSKQKGKEVVYRLVKKSDVFIENFRFGVAKKLGMDYPTLSQHNPRLVYGAATGWGMEGPDVRRPALDPAVQARSGFMLNVGEEGMPPLFGPMGMSDQLGGTFLVTGILAALFARDRTGKGQQVDASLFGSVIWLQQGRVAYNLMFGGHIQRYAREKAANVLYNRYQCADGRWLCFAMGQSDRYWHDFCDALKLGPIEADPKFDNADHRRDHGEELVAILDSLFASKPSQEWVKMLDTKHDLIYSPINSVKDLSSDCQALENKYVTELDHPTLGRIKVVGPPITLSDTPVRPRFAAPEFGQHTEEVLIETGGYTWDEIAQLKEEEVI
ncbi:MAG: CoA transferase [Chloroflexi bacterium]|nr:CoA transferase [Chloroflexota bacterium]